MSAFVIRRLESDADRAWAGAFLDRVLGGRMQARRGELIDTLEHEALVASGLAEREGERLGIVGWRSDDDGITAEITMLAVAPEARGQGIGRALLDAAVARVRAAGASRAWLVTTNDNLAALRLYQRAGWRLAVLRPGAVDAHRRTLKPAIPLVGDDGIPIRDELELSIELG